MDEIQRRAAPIARQIAERLEGTGCPPPRLGMILGSGWGAAAERMDVSVRIPFAHLEGMPACGVPGHAGAFACGTLAGKPAAAALGRLHMYEGHPPAEAVLPVAVLYELGVRTLVLTNAAGAVNAGFAAGEVMVIRDHINFTFRNPLTGLCAAERTRFVDLTQAYDEELRARLRAACADAGIPCREGIYMQLPGPSYETPAEIRAFRALGADAVGMSTAVEAVYARYLGMRVAGVSFLSNMAAGLAPGGIGHDEVLERSERSRASLAALLYAFAERL